MGYRLYAGRPNTLMPYKNVAKTSDEQNQKKNNL